MVTQLTGRLAFQKQPHGARLTSDDPMCIQPACLDWHSSYGNPWHRSGRLYSTVTEPYSCFPIDYLLCDGHHCKHLTEFSTPWRKFYFYLPFSDEQTKAGRWLNVPQVPHILYALSYRMSSVSPEHRTLPTLCCLKQALSSTGNLPRASPS